MFRIIFSKFFYDVIITRLDVMTSCCFFVSLSSLCFVTDEDGRAVEKIFCNTLFKYINYNLHEEMFCFNVYALSIFFAHLKKNVRVLFLRNLKYISQSM